MSGIRKMFRPVFVAWALGLISAAQAAVEQTPASMGSREWPEARTLLSEVIATLPNVPVRVEAHVQTRDRKGAIERTLLAEMHLNWGGDPPRAEYIIRDAFGAERERLRLLWARPDRPDYEYFQGDPPRKESLPDLTRSLEGSDIGWMDLSFCYLWWPGARTVGLERVKGRWCYIVEIPVPRDLKTDHATVRLWVEPRMRVVLQAAACDAEGQVRRLMEVRSLKRVRNMWLVQNLDVVRFPERRRTTLRVRRVAVADENIEP